MAKGHIEGEPWVEGDTVCVAFVVDEGPDETVCHSSSETVSDVAKTDETKVLGKLR